MKKAILLAFLFLLFSNSVEAGIIEVITFPENASVYVNGEYCQSENGQVNIPIKLEWIYKPIIIRVTKEGYSPQNKSIFIFTTEYYARVEFNLIPLNGTLHVCSTPLNASVKISGANGSEFFGRTPMSTSLKPGNYTMEIALENYSPYSTSIEIQPNETLKVCPDLVPLNGTLIIMSEPDNASVYVNGLFKGNTPLNVSLKPGKYIINVTKDGSWNATTITLEPNERRTVHLTIPEKSNPLGLILAVILLVTGSGAGIYFTKLRRGKGEEIPSKEQILATKEVPFDTAKPYITMKTLDGRAFGMSHVGARENNEDNLLVLKLSDAYLLAVADGLGGHNAGEVASKIAVDTLREVFEEEYSPGMSDKEVKELLMKAYEEAHRRIKESAVGEREGMGTTLVSAFVRDGKAIIANTGDSKAYLIRDGKILERTKDHSLVQELLDNGEITEEEARRHPMRNIITKALGVDFGVDLYEWEIREGDILLLSSDGLHDYVDEGRIIEITSKGKSAEDIVRELIDAALPVTKDNVTVVCLKL
ncbi:MAG TPA: PEGA domain-containing protein [Thermococcaceae archaeon]|nr:PEGA domain-containing protein [Thermococcaceae archaeon]